MRKTFEFASPILIYSCLGETCPQVSDDLLLHGNRLLFLLPYLLSEIKIRFSLGQSGLGIQKKDIHYKYNLEVQLKEGLDGSEKRKKETMTLVLSTKKSFSFIFYFLKHYKSFLQVFHLRITNNWMLSKLNITVSVWELN